MYQEFVQKTNRCLHGFSLPGVSILPSADTLSGCSVDGAVFPSLDWSDFSAACSALDVVLTAGPLLLSPRSACPLAAGGASAMLVGSFIPFDTGAEGSCPGGKSLGMPEVDSSAVFDGVGMTSPAFETFAPLVGAEVAASIAGVSGSAGSGPSVTAKASTSGRGRSSSAVIFSTAAPVSASMAPARFCLELHETFSMFATWAASGAVSTADSKSSGGAGDFDRTDRKDLTFVLRPPPPPLSVRSNSFLLGFSPVVYRPALRRRQLARTMMQSSTTRTAMMTIRTIVLESSSHEVWPSAVATSGGGVVALGATGLAAESKSKKQTESNAAHFNKEKGNHSIWLQSIQWRGHSPMSDGFV